MAYKGFQRLAETVRKLATVPARAAELASERIKGEIDRALDAGEDPYGRPFAALSPVTLDLHPHRGAPPLTDTGAMRDAIEVRPMGGAGIEIVIGDDGHGRPVPVATYHQTGTRRVRGWVYSDVGMPQRQIMPQSGGLPQTWRTALAEAASEAFGEVRRG